MTKAQTEIKRQAQEIAALEKVISEAQAAMAETDAVLMNVIVGLHASEKHPRQFSACPGQLCAEVRRVMSQQSPFYELVLARLDAVPAEDRDCPSGRHEHYGRWTHTVTVRPDLTIAPESLDAREIPYHRR